MREGVFRLEAPFEPAGDQPQAIEQIASRCEAGERSQTLLGVTGSGKTRTTKRSRRSSTASSSNSSRATRWSIS